LSEVWRPLAALPGYGLAGLLVLLLYAIQSEVRFGRKARRMSTGPADRGSTLAISFSSVIPVLGFVLAMKAPEFSRALLPSWFRMMPGMPIIAWVGVGIGALGLIVRWWSLLTLRDRYTRTLFTEIDQALERNGPYRFVRHPGYLGSLLCLNGIALASGNPPTVMASLVATATAYGYRIRVEDTMLVAQFGVSYESYCRTVGALLPFRSFRKMADESQPGQRVTR